MSDHTRDTRDRGSGGVGVLRALHELGQRRASRRFGRASRTGRPADPAADAPPAGRTAVAISRSFASVVKASSDGYIASAGTSSARNNATSRAACDARRARRRSVRDRDRAGTDGGDGDERAARSAAPDRRPARAPPPTATPAIQAAAATRGANARRVRQTLGSRVTLTALQITPACSSTRPKSSAIRAPLSGCSDSSENWTRSSGVCDTTAARPARRSRRSPSPRCRRRRTPARPRPPTSAVPTSRRGRRPTSRHRSMLSSVTQTMAVRASAVSSRSSGEVSGRRPRERRHREPEHHARDHDRDDEAGAGRDERSRRAGAPPQRRAAVPAHKQQRDADDRQHGRPGAASPARSSRGEIGRRDLGIDERAAARRGNDERVGALRRHVADPDAERDRNERVRQDEGVGAAGRAADRRRAAARRRPWPGERRGPVAIDDRLDAHQPRAQRPGLDEQRRRPVDPFLGQIRGAAGPGDRRAERVVDGDAGAAASLPR